MSCRGVFSVIVMFMVGGVCFATDDNQEFQANTCFAFSLDEMWKMSIAQEFHFRDGEHHESESIVSFEYKAADWLDLGFGFHQLYEKSGHDWLRENRPNVQATVKKTMWGLKWSDRNRLEFRDFEQGKDVFRYRNRLKAHVPHNLFGWPLQPYAAYEFFVQEESGFYRTRLYSGLVWEVNQKTEMDFFVYQERTDSGHGWDDRYIFGFETKFSF